MARLSKTWLLVGLTVANIAVLIVGHWVCESVARSGRMRVGVVFDVGGRGDKSFNDSAYRGLLRVERELDADIAYIEPGDGSDGESALRQFASQGFDLVIAVGFKYTEDTRKLAALFPHVRFACVDFTLSPNAPPVPDNLAGLRFREQDGSFVVGSIAGLMSGSKRVGFVGGMKIPLIRKFEAGFAAGVRHVCRDCQVLSAYIGASGAAFENPIKGKDLALAQIDGGADIIYHAAGKSGVGVIGAVKERGKLAIGVDSDQFDEAPCCVLTSMVKSVDTAVFLTAAAVAAGRFVGGIREFGLANGGISFVHNADNRILLSDDVARQARLIAQSIASGDIEVPSR